jgi:hypothetical protein
MQVLQDLQYVDWKMATDVANDLGAFVSLWLHDAEDKGAVVLRNVGNCSLIYTAYRAWILESAVTPLWEPEILDSEIDCCQILRSVVKHQEKSCLDSASLSFWKLISLLLRGA